MEPALTKHRVRKSVPWADLTPAERDVVWNGSGAWYGVKGLFDWLEKKRYKVHVRVLLARYRGYTTCPSCNGARLRPEALAVRIHEETMATLATKTLVELRGFLARGLDPRDEARGGALARDLVKRLDTLVEIGLPYLSLGRPLRTLSGGEAQRIQLGSAIGNALTGTLYVLDEPTVGLHALDTERLLGVLERLAAQGNAVVAVEHDTAVIRRAAHVVDLGPHAGRRGGEVVFENAARSRGARHRHQARAPRRDGRGRAAGFVRGSRCRERGRLRRTPLRGARPSPSWARAPQPEKRDGENPLGKLVAVAGVSGSGKSSSSWTSSRPARSELWESRSAG
jgi:excinuclease ABC subunit A